MRYLVGTLVAAIVGVTALFAAPAPACACSCAPVSAADARARADAVFTGTLTRREEPDNIMRSSADPARLIFKVDGVSKGHVAAMQGILTAMSGASCGLEVVVGHRYEVYAEVEDGALTASLCGGTRPAGPFPRLNAEPVPPTVATPGDAPTATYAPRAGEADTRGGGRGWAWPASAVGAGIVLGAVGLVVGRRRRPGS